MWTNIDEICRNLNSDAAEWAAPTPKTVVCRGWVCALLGLYMGVRLVYYVNI